MSKGTDRWASIPIPPGCEVNPEVGEAYLRVKNWLRDEHPEYRVDFAQEDWADGSGVVGEGWVYGFVLDSTETKPFKGKTLGAVRVVNGPGFLVGDVIHPYLAWDQTQEAQKAFDSVFKKEYPGLGISFQVVHRYHCLSEQGDVFCLVRALTWVED